MNSAGSRARLQVGVEVAAGEQKASAVAARLAVAGARTDGEPTVAAKAAADPLAPNATLITKGDRAALRLAHRAPGVARLLSRALSGKAQPQETHT